MHDAHARVEEITRLLYRERPVSVPYHGWHHVEFVAAKTAAYAADLSADVSVSVTAAYLHDLNYMVAAENKVENAASLRADVLSYCGFSSFECDRFEFLIASATTGSRTVDIPPESKALSDGDTAFKTLSLTPLMSALFMMETGSSLKNLADGIVREQTRLMEQGIYFYSEAARAEYGVASDVNLAQWRQVAKSLEDPAMEHLSAQFAAALKPFGEWCEIDRQELPLTLSGLLSDPA